MRTRRKQLWNHSEEGKRTILGGGASNLVRHAKPRGEWETAVKVLLGRRCLRAWAVTKGGCSADVWHHLCSASLTAPPCALWPSV